MQTSLTSQPRGNDDRVMREAKEDGKRQGVGTMVYQNNDKVRG